MNADRSVLVGVQELLPRRRRQRFALCACPERAVERSHAQRNGSRKTLRSARQPVPGKHDGNSSCPRLSASNFVAFHGRAIQLHE